jgi:ABC-type oligopeptide transport system ATPase subunit
MVKDKKNIVLIGFMGAGKTTVGRHLLFISKGILSTRIKWWKK